MNKRTLTHLLTALSLLLCSAQSHASSPDPEQLAQRIDQTVAEVMASYAVPGVAIAVVEGQQVVFANTYGVQEYGKAAPVTADSLFKIASVSKNFTTAALALLIDEGKLSWDDRVIDHLPEFRTSDPWITAEFRVRDLLIHSSGLNLGAGDLMFWPTPNDFTRADILKGLKYLPMDRGFRSRYAYDNILYVLAGELTERVAGMAWEDFVEQRLLQPLGMQACFAGIVPEQQRALLAQPHGDIDGVPTVVRRDFADQRIPSVAAGGMRCSQSAMIEWMKMQLARGRYSDADGNQQTLISSKNHAEMWKPQTLTGVGSQMQQWNNTLFGAYGYGWRINDVDGQLLIHHTGTLHGMNAYLGFLPQRNVGFLVLMNKSNGDARTTLIQTLIKSYTSTERHDWLAMTKAWRAQQTIRRAARFIEPTTQAVDPASIPPLLGVYRDPWFGDISIEQQQQSLRLRSHRSSRIAGELFHVSGTTYVVRWDDRTHEADAYVRFTTTMSGAIDGMLIEKIDPAADFSFNFEDLRLRKL